MTTEPENLDLLLSDLEAQAGAGPNPPEPPNEPGDGSTTPPPASDDGPNPWELPADGIHPDVLHLHYHQWKADFSQSKARDVRGSSPAHVHAQELAGGKTATRDMMIGSAGHMAVLQPDEFDRWVKPTPAGNKNSNAYKDAVARLKADHPWALILDPDDIAICHRANEAVRAYPEFREILEAVEQPELSVVWTEAVDVDGETVPLRMKARLDAPVIGELLLDLKFTRSARPRDFGRQAWDTGLHIQAAMNLLGAMRLGIQMPPVFVFGTVEKKGDHLGVGLHTVPGNWLHYGEAEAWDLMEQWARCKLTGQFPGYQDGFTPLAMPHWAETEMQLRYGTREGI